MSELYIERLRQCNDLADAVLAEKALAHAVNLSVLIVYGDPKIDEPLSSAWQRCGNNPANPDGLLTLARHPFDKAAAMTAVVLRELVIPSLPGVDEKGKLDAVFASAPPWLIWFTFGDFTADTLGLRLPDLSSMTRFARPQAIFDRWPALPRGTFKRRPWPDGSDTEPITPEDRERFRKAVGLPNDQMSARERMRALTSCANTPRVKRKIKWPPHPPGSEKLRELFYPEPLPEPDDESGECEE
jgi:hypothetical protein